MSAIRFKRQVWGAMLSMFIWAIAGSAQAQTVCNRNGPDVIIGDLPEVSSWGSVGNVTAFSIGTTSCNVGNVNLLWVANTNQHPVIAQNLYRLKNSRMEQIGMSWLKHGFLALTLDVCNCGCNGQGGQVLGVGCSDPYGSALNGQQGSSGTGGLGPRFEINAHTGFFPFPYSSQGLTGDAIYKRLQVHNSDLDPVQNGGGLYFIEGQYVSPDDASAGNQNNNASYRRAEFTFIGNNWTMSVTDTTQRERPAIRAWKDNDSSVLETDIQLPGEGLFILAAKAWGLESGLYHYEYALHNLNSDLSGQSFSVPITPGTTVANIGFHDVDYHSGDGIGNVNIDGTDWLPVVTANAVTWSTQTFTENQNANALRWGTLYNFRFDANVLPQQAPGLITIDLFKPGPITNATALTVVPSNVPIALTIWLPNGPPATLVPGVYNSFDVKIIPGVENLSTGSAMLHYRYDGGSFLTSPLSPLGGALYRATLPPASCGQTPELYLSAQGSGATVVTSPIDAPASIYSAVMGAEITTLSDDFETDQGWTVENIALTDGAWERGVPAGDGTQRDPPTDFDGSGQCYVTGNVIGSDVDGGPTRLVSPTLDLSAAVDPVLQYARWFNSSSFGADHMDVEISPDDGATWILVESIPFTLGWVKQTVRILDFVTPTALMKVRFSTSDNPDNSVTEAAIDAVLIQDFRCVQPPCILGDVDNDFLVNGHDIDRFLQILINGGGTSQEICAGDLHVPADGTIDINDVDDFVAQLLSI